MPNDILALFYRESGSSISLGDQPGNDIAGIDHIWQSIGLAVSGGLPWASDGFSVKSAFL